MFPRAWSCYLQRLLRICYVIFLFQLPFALWYARFELSYKFLQILIRGTGVADYYNIILLRLNIEVHIFHCSRGGRLAALLGVCIVWKLEPLASGGQSSYKLIPHIICQFLYARWKTLNEDLFYKGSSVLSVTLNYIWWWSSSSENLLNVKNSFIAITPSSILVRTGSSW